MHNRSSKGFKLCRLVVRGSMALVYEWRPRRVQLFARREEVPLGAVVALTIAGPSKVDALVQF